MWKRVESGKKVRRRGPLISKSRAHARRQKIAHHDEWWVRMQEEGLESRVCATAEVWFSLMVSTVHAILRDLMIFAHDLGVPLGSLCPPKSACARLGARLGPHTHHFSWWAIFSRRAEARLKTSSTPTLSALLNTKFVWPRDEFPARTIMNLLFPGLAMSVAERTEQQVLRRECALRMTLLTWGRGLLVAAMPLCAR
jgi:hypothetical protein